MKNQLFQTRSAHRSFWALLGGVLIIMAGMISAFGVYINYVRHPYSKQDLAQSINKVVTLARLLPPQHLHKASYLLSQPHVFVRIERHPYHKANIVMQPDAKNILQFINTHPQFVMLSTELAHGWWLNIFAERNANPWLLVGLIISVVALLLGLILLCLFIVKRLSLPLAAFSQAAKQFGLDINAPPLAQSGTPEMQDLIQSFNEMQSRIRRLLNDRTQMLAAISHDLRTPITRLQLRAEYLTDKVQHEKALADLKEMENMITSILSFARDYVRTEKMERFDINALLHSICDELVDVGQAVIYTADNQRVPYSGRVSALKRAFSNIIENAVKYGDTATVSLSYDNKQLQIKVIDCGPGIPEDEMEKVFAPFYRIDSSRSLQKSGTGLGLAVARDIIRAHGGEVQLYNTKPAGLIVLISLPNN